jgi:ankyrin repeat protein
MINPSSVHDVDVHGWTALHWAAQNADEPGLDILIAAGSNVNAISRDGTSVLMMAAQARSATCCQKLIDAGADVQFREQHGNNALSFGLRCADVVLLLLRHGVDVNFTHIFGYSCLHHAIETADPEICKLLLDYGADTEALDAHGESPAFWAVRFNKLASVKLLYERGAVLNRPSEHGKSVIHYAAAFGGLQVMQILEEARIEGLSMTPDDVDRYWYWFYMNRPPYFVGERPPIEVEEERFLALLDSVIGNKSDEATITNELPQLPGNFPKEVEIFEQEQNNLTDDDDEYEFLDAVES